MKPEKVDFPEGMLEWWGKMCETAPHPEKSSADDPELSPKRIYERLEHIAKTGVVETEEDRSLYQNTKLAYEGDPARQEQH